MTGALAFVRWELRAPEPVLPMRLFSNPTFRILIGGNAIYGAAGMGMMSFFPLFFQVSLGEAATTAGLILASSGISVSLGSYISGRVTTGTGRYRVIIQTAPVLTAIAVLSFTFLDVDSSAYAAIPWLALMGMSMGLAFPTMTTAVQNSLALPDLGAGTAALNFFRALGQTIGVGAFGALLTSRINSELAGVSNTVDVDELLSTPEDIQALEPELRSAVEGAVAVATNSIFWVTLPLVGIFVLATRFLPELELRTTTALAARHDD